MKFNVDINKNINKLYQELEPELKEHCENVARLTERLYSLAMERNLFAGKLTNEVLLQIKDAVIYHDLGKCVFESEFLDKKEPLTYLERRWINRHVDFGLMLLEHEMSADKNCENNIFIRTAWESIAHHHERYNGLGYPNKLMGDNISPIGQMCGICDYYDALTSDRAYHKAFSHNDTVNRIKQDSGIFFNPELVELFVEHEDEFYQIKNNSSCIKEEKEKKKVA
ncbi:HD-GYP domain-containing protein [Eubacterium sp.]|uniref:HD-GYP domain-containing protein n=1 Tax=Eubacterium sp. TaxID=142586 RepID=UPI002FC88EEB